MRVLSTKKLKINQRDLLLNAGFSVIDYNAIKIEFLTFEMPSEIKNAIFTSQNGVRAFVNKNLEAEGNSRVTIKNCFCIGPKTRALLEKNGLNVVKSASNGADLGNYIAKNWEGETFHFFCGEQRRDEIPEIAERSNITVTEITTYRTIAQPQTFTQVFDGILFFSPSGVESYFKANDYDGDEVNYLPQLFCIGETTAKAAEKYSNRIVIANATSVESVIAKTVKTLKNYD